MQVRHDGQAFIKALRGLGLIVLSEPEINPIWISVKVRWGNYVLFLPSGFLTTLEGRVFVLFLQFLHQVDIFSTLEDFLGLSHVEGAAHPFVSGIGGENGRTWKLAAFPFTLLQQRPLAFVERSVVLHVKAGILVVLKGQVIWS